MEDEIGQRVQTVESEVSQAALRSGRDPNDIRIVCVSKRQPLEKLLALEKVYTKRNREVIFGENYVQEAKKRRGALSFESKLHLIGPLQSNKAKDAVRCCDVIESVHNEKILDVLNKEAGKIGKQQEIFLQVNISDDPAKSGFLPDSLSTVLAELHKWERLSVIGLMTITRQYDDAGLTRADFRALRQLRDDLGAESSISGLQLSMGMSADYQIAIEEGADLVRIGTAIFGPRPEST